MKSSFLVIVYMFISANRLPYLHLHLYIHVSRLIHFILVILMCCSSYLHMLLQ